MPLFTLDLNRFNRHHFIQPDPALHPTTWHAQNQTSDGTHRPPPQSMHLFAARVAAWNPLFLPSFSESMRPIKFYLTNIKHIWNVLSKMTRFRLSGIFWVMFEVKPIWSIAKEKAHLPHKNSTTKSLNVWTVIQRIGNLWWDDHVLVGATKFRLKVSACSN